MIKIGYIKEISRISVMKTIFYNFFSSKVKRNKGYIIVYKGVSLKIDRNAKIEISNGVFLLGFGQTSFSRVHSLIRLNEGSKLSVSGRMIIEYGADILLKRNAVLEFGDNSYINCRCFIRCHEHIAFGKEVLISNGLNLRDSDGHSINGRIGMKPVMIMDHVWIGTNVTILKGVCISSGVMIGANSLVTKSIPEKCLAYGVPAKVNKENINWEY